ncbi:aspartoacylase [Myxosarcina sp. GI1(2024)]
MNQIQRVTIVGGIHGNELLGIYLVKKFRKFPQILQRYTDIEIKTLLANPKAIASNKRYIDIDLNRCFDLKDLSDRSLVLYEQLLAKAIYQQFKSERSNDMALPPSEFIIDIHTTTANMGITLLLSNELPFNLNLVAYLVALNPKIKLVCAHSKREKNRLRSISPYGFTLEVGSIPHGVLDPIWFAKTEALIFSILDYITKFNRQQKENISDSLTLYSVFKAVSFPLDEIGEINAMVHPQLHGKDYCALHPRQPIFLKFDGSTILYKGNETVYPIFINESAYGEKNIAMYFTSRKQVFIPLDKKM